MPPDRITGTTPGHMFVHRNIANLVVQTDMNLLSVLQYAVEVLKVEHVIVCGHYGCGGVKAAMGGARHGLIDNWLRTLKDTQDYYWRAARAARREARFARMVELNVIEQVYNLGQDQHRRRKSWAITGKPYVHGWVFDLKTGYIRPQTGMINSDEGHARDLQVQQAASSDRVAAARRAAAICVRAAVSKCVAGPTISQAMSQPILR